MVVGISMNIKGFIIRPKELQPAPIEIVEQPVKARPRIVGKKKMLELSGNDDRIKIKCHNCKYEWKSRTRMVWTTCPSCQNKTLAKKDVPNVKSAHHS